MKVKQATRPPGKEPGWQTVCVCVCLVVAVWAVFGQSAGFGFVNLDDNVYVFENPKVARGLSLEGIAYAFSHAECHLYHPLTMISLRLDYQLHGLHVGGYHLTNVLIHTASVILLFLILRRMTGALWRSAFVAAVFAIHPLRVESVAWVTERKDVLGTFFFMLTLWAYVRHAEKCVIHYSLFTIHYSLALFFFVLGLLSKPIAVTLPFVLLLLDYWPLNRFTPWRPTGAFGIPRRLILEKVPLMALAAAACVVTYDTAEKAVMTAAQVSLPMRIGNALVSYVVYLRQTVWPAGLAVFYPLPQKGLPLWEMAVAFLLLAVITGWSLAAWRTRPWLLTGWFWYLGMLVPVMGIVQTGGFAHADRNTYLPQIGLCIVLTWAVAGMTAGWRYRRLIQGGGSAAILAVLIFCAHAQAACWRNSELLWDQALSCTSGNYVAHYNLGDEYVRQGKLDEAIKHCKEALESTPDKAKTLTLLGVALYRKGDGEAAIAQYRKALEIEPDYAEARYNLGTALLAKGNLEEAIAQYRHGLAKAPDNAQALNGLGNALALKGEDEAAIEQYQKALQIQPGYAEAHYGLGHVLLKRGQLDEAVGPLRRFVEIKPDDAEARFDLGNALYAKGDREEAIAQFRKAVEIKPDYAEAGINLGNALYAKGDLDAAIAQYRKTAKTKPDFVEVRNNLGAALLAKGDLKEAVDAWQKSLELKPGQLPVQNNLAWLLATTPDASLRNGAEARTLAEQANQLSGGGQPEILRTLAAAYAEEGNYGQAVATARHALELAAAQKNDALAAALRQEIQNYEANTPVRTAPR